MFLHVIGDQNKEGGKIHGWEGYGNEYSVWEFAVEESKSIETIVVGIRNVKSKFFINVWGGNINDGAELKLYPNFSENSKFILEYIEEPNVVAFIGLKSRRLISLDNGSSGHNGAIIH